MFLDLGDDLPTWVAHLPDNQTARGLCRRGKLLESFESRTVIIIFRGNDRVTDCFKVVVLGDNVACDNETKVIGDLAPTVTRSTYYVPRSGEGAALTGDKH
jgi:hypothetical protein